MEFSDAKNACGCYAHCRYCAGDACVDCACETGGDDFYLRNGY